LPTRYAHQPNRLGVRGGSSWRVPRLRENGSESLQQRFVVWHLLKRPIALIDPASFPTVLRTRSTSGFQMVGSIVSYLAFCR
jgi:hypothetical protein